ncbi:Putative ribonuclease H protein At1g65750 [Linum perenne]
MMKIGWQILKFPDKLWVQVLTTKYLKHGAEGLEIRRKNWGSVLWRGVRSVWPSLRQSCQTSIRNGCNTLFWYDTWIDSGISLSDVALQEIDEEEGNRTVAEAVDENGNWNWSLLNSFLPSEFVSQVAGMPPPTANSGEDELIWGPDPKGSFTLKSAYEIRAAINHLAISDPWRTVWNWQGPNRIRFFLWLVAHNRLLTNAERRRRHLCATESCSRCSSASEDAIHVLRDCKFARDLWLSLIPTANLQSFFAGTLQDWLCRELQNAEFGQLVGIACWLLWKARNEAIFDKVSVTSDQLRLRVLFWIAGVRETMKAHSQSLSGTSIRRRETLLSWIPPPDAWFAINTDGSVIQPSSSAAAGGLVRDSSGRLKACFSANLGSCTIMRAELRAAAIGLTQAWELGVKKAILYMDSLAAISSISQSGAADTRHGPVISHIRGLLSRQWEVEIRHTYRETNKAADLLANLGHSLDLGTHFLHSCPATVRKALADDCMGVTYPRLIPFNG